MAVRLNININDETETALRELAETKETSVTDIVRRAVAVYKFIEDETGRGQVLQLVDRANKEVTTLAMA